MGKHMKLTEQERATIIDALTVAACQYVKDADQAADLALHGLSMSAAAETLAARVSTDRRRRQTTTRQNDVLVGAP